MITEPLSPSQQAILDNYMVAARDMDVDLLEMLWDLLADSEQRLTRIPEDVIAPWELAQLRFTRASMAAIDKLLEERFHGLIQRETRDT